MKTKLINQSIFSLALLTIMNSASAATFDFGPTNLGVAGSNAYHSVSQTANDISVEVTAYTLENDGEGNLTNQIQILDDDTGVYVSINDNLGVVSSSTTDGHHLDGGDSDEPLDLDEGLLFSFDQVVNLTFINFDSFTSSDDFNLTVDGTLILLDFEESSSSAFASAVTGQTDEFNFFNISGQEFLIWADDDSDGFRIDEINVSAVPVPTAVWLFGSGLIGLAGIRKKT